jgi:hypothetical protein
MNVTILENEDRALYNEIVNRLCLHYIKVKTGDSSVNLEDYMKLKRTSIGLKDLLQQREVQVYVFW